MLLRWCRCALVVGLLSLCPRCGWLSTSYLEVVVVLLGQAGRVRSQSLYGLGQLLLVY